VDGQSNGPLAKQQYEIHTFYAYYSPNCPSQLKDLAKLNQQWIYNRDTKWLQLKNSPQKKEAIPIPACLTIRPATNDGPALLYRQPCRGGNATGLNQVTKLEL
jgi:hypothetical protein